MAGPRTRARTRTHSAAVLPDRGAGRRPPHPRGLDRERPIILTPKEFDLLALLAEDPGAVYSRQEILDRVWDLHFHGPTKTLDVHVATLRRKLGDPAWIQTLRGVGLRLAVRPRSDTNHPESQPR